MVGVNTILYIHSYPKLPKGFTHMGNDPSAKTVDSVEVSDQSEEGPPVYRLLDVPYTKGSRSTSQDEAKEGHQAQGHPQTEGTADPEPSNWCKGLSIESDEELAEPKFGRMARLKPKPRPKSMAAPKKVVPSKRQAVQAGLDEEDGHAQLEHLEVERHEIEKEQAEILERQADRK
ncbi:hypothetical protein SLS61_002931 [Didymella pomorum]